MLIAFFACKGLNRGIEEPIDQLEESDPLAAIADIDTLIKWQNWAMASDEGLWEGDTSHNVRLSLVQTYGGEEETAPPFFSVKCMQVSGDTLFIADRARECLVCMNSSGEVFWEFGDSGEGPGHFSRIGPISVSGNWVAVCSIDGDKVELVSRSGESIRSISIQNPLYVEAISTDTFAVISKAEPGGDIHLFDINGDHLFSFGDCAWVAGEHIQRSTNAYSALLIGNRYLVVNHFFEYGIAVFDLQERQLVTEFARIHPSGNLPTSSLNELEDGYVAGTYFFLLGKVFTGPEGAINVKLDAIQRDGSVISSRTTIGPAPVTVIDRYSLAGDYLDSYCIPIPNCTVFRYSSPYLFVAQSSTGTIYQFLVE